MDSKRHGIEYPLEILQRRGAAVLKETPRTIIGTVHSVKGGEADTVMLFPDISAAGAKEWARSKEGRDAVIRQYYVGITRAKETLILGGQATGMAVQM
jgi:superfamily I DNA/RNA helicase